ncbi:mechanosensitive ion channel family protein [Schinkia azotoformans]|nr:mechanosensitive ion channel family protein [Schinkia azotoformans]MEC1695599.1 mechanosensitive ion channel family protein [Schinkia azotoformans]MEC1723993.1 mechanosensitive ion channel family protein [Schinkia azotoformans]MEC1770888.1 mechanosensitive ion channel family protein [Schinkia azotoformans]MEC1777840.1 mechanosensitive ion channel family protein [Schinkia azotoformans]MED4329249.1 mechanosensitive ion channel family protein [Schinkia azotoformans]
MWESIMTYEFLYEVSISVGIFLLFLILRKVFTKYIFHLILKLAHKTPTDLFSHIWLSFEKPIGWLFVIIGFNVAASFFPYIDPRNPIFVHIMKSLIILMITWGLYNVASASSIAIMKINKKLNVDIDEILIPFLSKTIRFIIVAISLSIILQEFNYNINSLVAGLGIGGVAVALAAKDALGNLFGGLIIITEKPFSIGDWIMTPTVEGTVEDITFRSTKIRTFAQALVTVPNATLANEAITNWSKMGKRRITFQLGVTYETPKEKLENTINKIEEMLKNHPSIHPDTIFVTFDNYNVNSLDIFLYFFTKTTVWAEYLQAKQDINFQIMEILESEGVQVALPTRTLITTKESESMMKAATKEKDRVKERDLQ